MDFNSPDVTRLTHYLNLEESAPDVYDTIGLIEIHRMEAELLVEDANATWTVVCHAGSVPFVLIEPHVG